MERQQWFDEIQDCLRDGVKTLSGISLRLGISRLTLLRRIAVLRREGFEVNGVVRKAAETERNLEIYEAVKDGQKLVDVAKQYRVSQQRISQIVYSVRPYEEPEAIAGAFPLGGGEHIGLWTVLEKGDRYWKCRCRCGVTRSVLKYDLIKGRSRSCRACAVKFSRRYHE